MLKNLVRYDLGSRIEWAARSLAAAAVLAFCAGAEAKVQLIRLLDWFTFGAPPTSAPKAVPALPVVHPLAAVEADLNGLTVAQLRSLTGYRGKCRKAELVTLALAL